MIATLANGVDTYHFTVGMRLQRSGDSLVYVGPPSLWWRFKSWLRSKFAPKYVVTEVNVKPGTITVDRQRRWWERK